MNDLLTSMTEMSEVRFLHHFSIIKYSISKKMCTVPKKGLSTVSNQKGQPLPLQSIRENVNFLTLADFCVLLKRSMQRKITAIC